MNFRLKRLIETTMPMIILNGIAVWVITVMFNKWIGILWIVLYALIDVIMLRKNEVENE